MESGDPQSRDDEPQEAERASGIMRIPNVSPEDEEGLLRVVESEIFDKQSVSGLEREKTPEEVEIINGILAKLPGFIKRYGGRPVNLRLDHVHVIDSDKLTDQQKINIGNVPGKFITENQKALIISEFTDYSAIKFAEVALHELIHFNSFQSNNYNRKTRKLSERTTGMGMWVVDDENPKNNPEFYFHEVNEAVTAELTKRFCEEYFGLITALAEDVKKRDEFRIGTKKVDATEVMAIYNNKDSDGMWHATSEDYPYADERKNGWTIMKEIQEKNPDKFKDAEEVFRIFTEAYFTGNKLKIAKLVEKTFGKGFFRRLGRNTKAK